MNAILKSEVVCSTGFRSLFVRLTCVQNAILMRTIFEAFSIKQTMSSKRSSSLIIKVLFLILNFESYFKCFTVYSILFFTGKMLLRKKLFFAFFAVPRCSDFCLAKDKSFFLPNNVILRNVSHSFVPKKMPKIVFLFFHGV